MTNYEYDSLPTPTDLMYAEPVPAELLEAGYSAVKQAVESTRAEAQEIRMAYVYGEDEDMTFRAVDAPKTKSYFPADPEILLQLTVRIPNPSRKFWGTDGLEAVEELETKIIELSVEAKRKALKAELDALEETQAEAIRLLEEKRQELEGLNTK